MDAIAPLATTGTDAVTDSPRPSRRLMPASDHAHLIPHEDLLADPTAERLVARFFTARSAQGVTDTELKLLRNAYAVAAQFHAGVKRNSGEPYIIHPIAVADLLLDLQLDAASVAAALLHDVVEDTSVTQAQIEELFGQDVALIVDGVTKLSRLEHQTKEDAQASTHRKFFVSIAEDPRVLLVKLADRLHNLRTIGPQKLESRQRTAHETLDIYAPLAHRLGIWQFKWELEDRAFAALHPEKYQEIERQLHARRDMREKVVARVITRLQQMLKQEGIEADVTGRPKHIYSIYRKMERKGVGLDQIFDQLAVRVIIGRIEEPATSGARRRDRRSDPDVGQCYQVLGRVHALWPPVPGEFDDYIARPKESLYQSLHTTVLIPGGVPCEIQIRTAEMHRVAEHGIAAHWRYKEGDERPDVTFESKLAWLRQVIDWRRDMTDPHEFVDSVQRDELAEQMYTLSPKGKVIELPIGSTPVDFAYRIHSEVGESCTGARVNNRMVGLDHQLKNSDIVQIITAKTPRGPSRDWLGFVRTSQARNHIRRFFKRQDYSENAAAGREMLEKELKRLAVVVAFEDIARLVSAKSVEDMFAQLGVGDLAARHVGQRILAAREPEAFAPLPAAPAARAAAAPRSPAGITVRGEKGMLMRIARCCNPLNGEQVLGFVTRGKGVTVHRADCHTILNVADSERGRIVEVAWGESAPEQGNLIPVRIEAWDRVGLWRDVSTEIANARINIHELEQVPTRKVGRAVLMATLRIQDVGQLVQIIDRLNRMPDVIEARRESAVRSTP